MADYNKTCYVCGKEYRYCPNCAEFANAPSWMNMYDSEDCLKIDNTLNALWFNHISKAAAKEMLEGIDLGKITNKDLLVAVKKLEDEAKKTKDEEKKSFGKKRD